VSSGIFGNFSWLASGIISRDITRRGGAQLPSPCVSRLQRRMAWCFSAAVGDQV